MDVGWGWEMFLGRGIRDGLWGQERILNDSY